MPMTTHSESHLDGVLVEIVLQHLLHYLGRHLGVLLLRDAAGGDLHRALAVLAEALDAVVRHTGSRHPHALQEIKVMKKIALINSQCTEIGLINAEIPDNHFQITTK